MKNNRMRKLHEKPAPHGSFRSDSELGGVGWYLQLKLYYIHLKQESFYFFASLNFYDRGVDFPFRC